MVNPILKNNDIYIGRKWFYYGKGVILTKMNNDWKDFTEIKGYYDETRHLTRFESLHLIKTRRNPKDKRKIQVKLTITGNEASKIIKKLLKKKK